MQCVRPLPTFSQSPLSCFSLGPQTFTLQQEIGWVLSEESDISRGKDLKMLSWREDPAQKAPIVHPTLKSNSMSSIYALRAPK